MKNTLPCVSLKQSQTNIYVSPHLATFVESFSKLPTHDNFDSRKYMFLDHTLIVIMFLHLMYSLMMRSIINLSCAGSDAKEQVEAGDPYSSVETPIAETLNLSGTVRNEFLFQLKPMIIIKEQL